MKNMTIQIRWMMGMLVLLLAGCDKESDDMVLPVGRREIVVSGVGTGFVQKRDAIGQNETGPKFGEFYFLKTMVLNNQPLEKPRWGCYKVTDGVIGELTAKDKASAFYWEEDEAVKYTFHALSNPPAANYADDKYPVENPVAGVHIDTLSDGTAQGRVMFGDYSKGLEYFVGHTVSDKVRPGDFKLSMAFKRQVSKLVFCKFIHKNKNGETQEPVESCKIIFPNLPKQATFNMAEFHQFDNTVATSTRDFHYVTFHYDTDEDNLGIEFEWRQRYTDEPNQRLYHALYVPPFKFWEGEDGRPESQLGFFIVMYDNKSYTGNIYGINLDNNGKPTGKDATQVQAGEMCRFDEIILQDGPVAGGGDGSIIIPWSTKEEEDMPQHRYSGVYSADDMRLYEALKAGADVPQQFYEERGGGKKVIRLFANVDWSQLTGELWISEEYILAGQGYNITLGEGGSLTCRQEGKLYINKELYVDGVKQEQG